MHPRPDRREALALCAALALPAWAASASTDLVFGQCAWLSGPQAARWRDFGGGVRLALDAVNASGGHAGRRLRWDPVDDRGQEALADAACRRWAADPACLALLGCGGNATTLATLPLLARAGLASLALQDVGDATRLELARHGYAIRASLAQEAEALARHLGAAGLRRVGLVHEAHAGGQERLRLLGDACAARGLVVVGSAAVTDDSATADEAVRKLAALSPQALLLAVPGRLAGELAGALRALGKSLPLAGLSMLADDDLLRRRGERSRGLSVALVVPNPWGTSQALALEFRRLATGAGLPVNPASYEGYLGAQVLLEALRRCGRELTRARLHAVIDTLQMNVGGMEVDFSRRELGGSRWVEIVQVAGDGRLVS